MAVKKQLLAEPKQSGHIGCNLAQIARSPQMGIGKLARLVFPRLKVVLPQKPDWPEFQFGARLDLPDWCQMSLARPDRLSFV